MLDDIINNYKLIGKSEKELFELVGTPFTKGKFNEKKLYQFRTSVKNGQYLHWYLFTELRNDTVIYTQKSLD
tara:strand:- start:123 stop:338 length:216 start_codon:yes stop_codon:yes gene_type:complete